MDSTNLLCKSPVQVFSFFGVCLHRHTHRMAVLSSFVRFIAMAGRQYEKKKAFYLHLCGNASKNSTKMAISVKCAVRMILEYVSTERTERIYQINTRKWINRLNICCRMHSMSHVIFHVCRVSVYQIKNSGVAHFILRCWLSAFAVCSQFRCCFFLQFSFGQVFCILFCKLCCISFEHDFLFWGKERDSVSRLMYSDDDDYSSSCFNTIIFDPLPILSCNF